MKERIAKLIGNGVESKLLLGTFHSVCRRYLVRYGHLIGIRNSFGIADSSDTLAIVNRIIKRHQLNIEPKAARARISSTKARGTAHADLNSNVAKRKSLDQQEFSKVFEEYDFYLTSANLLDYDDLLLRCLELLRQHPQCVSNVEAVLIDEFQDTNVVQFELMKLFATARKRITTVGDPDQSIYGWRSAEIRNLKRMREQYPDTLIINLEDNYRSSGAILLAALELIEQDQSRPSKPLLPTHCPATTPVLRHLPSAATEAIWIVTEIRRCIALMGSLLSKNDFAILLRSASLSRHIESVMGKSGIPYRMVGGQRFFDRIEVKIMLDYLRVIYQPDNNDALARILNVPPRRIGDTTVKTLLEQAEVKKISLWALTQDVVQGNIKSVTKISRSAETGLGQFSNIILTARKNLLNPDTPHSPKQLIESILKKLNFQEFIDKNHPEDHETRWANVEELIAQASDCVPDNDESWQEGENYEEDLPQVEGVQQEKSVGAKEALAKFLGNVALSTDLRTDDEHDSEGNTPERVTISTIHAAKGLEWPVVFIPSAYEGSIPHSRAEDTDEERRLLYVAMTRAQALLYVSCPKKNSMREETTLSTFLSAKKVARYLTNKAPSLKSNVVFDISLILRRECPSEQALFDGQATVENLEDDLWPLNGEEDPDRAQARWTVTNPNVGQNTLGALARHSRSQMGNGRDSSHPVPTYGSGISSTLMNSSSYTIPSISTGFISATSQLNQITEQERLAPDKKPKHTLRDTEEKKDVKKKKETIAYGGLASFWGPPSQMRPLAVQNTSQLNTIAFNGSEKHQEGLEPLTLPVPAQVGRPGSSAKYDRPRTTDVQPIIPSDLSTHRFRPLSNPIRAYKIKNDDNISSKPYVFLSSSPPPVITTEPHPPQISNEYGSMTLPSTSTTTSTYPNNTKPASTFHTTSITSIGIENQDQDHNQYPSTKKTLGLRRGMAGWNPKGPNGRARGFAPPMKISKTS